MDPIDKGSVADRTVAEVPSEDTQAATAPTGRAAAATEAWVAAPEAVAVVGTEEAAEAGGKSLP